MFSSANLGFIGIIRTIMSLIISVLRLLIFNKWQIIKCEIEIATPFNLLPFVL